MNPYHDPKDDLIRNLSARVAELETEAMIWRRTARLALRFAIYTQHQTLSPALQLRLYDKLLQQAEDARRFTGETKQGRAA